MARADAESCTTLDIFFYQADIKAGRFTTPVGFGLREVPFYSAETGDKIGIYTDFANNLGNPDAETIGVCLATGSFSWTDENGDVVSTVNLSFTCASAENAIVGGTGEYSCANGYETFESQDETTIKTNLIVCGTPCSA